jgi:DNA-binding transcriptional regulator YdaS (Cro superfamily)
MSNEMDQNDTNERENLLRRVRYGPVSIDDQTCTKCALREAIAVAGSKSELARRLGVTPRCIRPWMEFGWIPAEQAVCLEVVTAIARHRFAPRIFQPVAEIVARGTDRDAPKPGVRD